MPTFGSGSTFIAPGCSARIVALDTAFGRLQHKLAGISPRRSRCSGESGLSILGILGLGAGAPRSKARITPRVFSGSGTAADGVAVGRAPDYLGEHAARRCRIFDDEHALFFDTICRRVLTPCQALPGCPAASATP
jgi:hypothetical protein